MMELSDRELLDRFAARRDEVAFRTLVERHLALVHGIARRVSGNDDLARDVAQSAFVRLAERAALIPNDLSLAAWLHRVTHHLAIDLVRREDCRRRYERATADPSLMDADESSVWPRVAPVLDDLINRLPAADRELVLLRYYRNEPHAAVARKLGLTEAAAKKRASRALEKLRSLLARKGIATTATALATLLPAHAATPVPGSFALSIAAAAGGTMPLAARGLNLHLAMTTTQKTTIVAAAVIFLVSAGYSVRSSSPESSAAGMHPHAVKAGEGSTEDRTLQRRGRAEGSPSSAEDRLERLRQIVAMPKGLQRIRMMLAFNDELSPSQFAETADQLVQLNQSAFEPEFGIVVGDWVKSDPLAAVAWARANSPLEGLRETLKTWGGADPDRAMDWVMRNYPGATGNDPKGREALVSVLAGISSNDLKAAVKGLELIPNLEDRSDATHRFANAMGSERPRAVVELLEILGPGPQYSTLLAKNSVTVMGKMGTDRALEMFLADEGALKIKPIGRYFYEWQVFFPQEAVAALSRVPAGDLQNQAVQACSLAAVERDAPSGFALLDRYPGAVTDTALAEMARACPIEHAALGVDQVLRIKDPSLRDQVLTDRLKWWLKSQESEARTWIETHPLSDEVHAALESSGE